MKNKLFIIGLSTCLFGGLLTYILKRRRRIKKIRLSDLVGNTPLLYLKSLSELCDCDIYAKAEFMNPTGSMKDRTALSIIQGAIRRGQLSEEKPWIYEGTSGSTGISLVAIGHSMGFKTKVFLPDDLAQEKYDQLELLKADIVKVQPVSIVDKNHFCRLAEDQAKQDQAFFAHQFHNLDNIKTHYDITGKEIWSQTHGKIDCFVMSAGTGGTIAGVSKYLKEQKKDIKIILADPPGSSLKNRVKYKVCYTNEEAEGYRVKHPFDTIVEGVGQNRMTINFEFGQIDDAFTIDDIESLHMGHFLIENEGLCVGSSSAMNCVAVIKSVRKYPHLKSFVTVLADQGTRYVSKFYSKQYLKEKNIQFVPKSSYKGENYNLDFIK